MWSDEQHAEDTALDALTPQSDVRFELEVEGVNAVWGVRAVTLREAVSEPFQGMISAVVQGDPPELGTLLGKKFALRIERQHEQRLVRGIVRRAHLSDHLTHAQYTLHVVSSLWLMGLGVGSGTNVRKTVPELVGDVVRLALEDDVHVNTEALTQTYEVHELIVQYQESLLNFITRWMEQEGIFYFLTVEDDREQMVLVDSMDNLPFARAARDGRVAHRGPMAVGEAETIFGLAHGEELGVTQVTISEPDWTRPSRVDRQTYGVSGVANYVAEVYDHTDSVTFHRYADRHYGYDTAPRAAQIRAQALRLMRQRWSMRGDVVTAQPGHVLRVEGAPEGDLDGAYMIVRCESGGTAAEGVPGTWSNTLVVVPTSVAYRPAPATPRPVVPGPETAFVVAPDGQEIHTDEHGRVKVHFHWDRDHGRTDEDASCWIRVAHNWAGDGFGTFFLPRAGMEVIVEFLGGNPDRPVVTGCVYNGEALAHVDLPTKKTQSYIRTKSSQHSNGYNEIRFEDDAGHEFVSVHAQKDLRERVLHDHTARVDHDQKDEVGNDQTLTVHNNRMKTVDKDETNTIGHNRGTEVGVDDVLHVKNNSYTTVDNNKFLDVLGNLDVHVVSAQAWTIDRGSTLTVTGGVTQTIQSGGWTMTTTGDVVHGISGNYALNTGSSVNLKSGTEMTLDSTLALRVKAQSVTLSSDTGIYVRAPQGIRNLSPADEQSIITTINHTAQQWMDRINSKFGMYVMAITLADIKVDVVSQLKVDLWAMKIDSHSGLGLSNGLLKIGNATSAWVERGAIRLLG